MDEDNSEAAALCAIRGTPPLRVGGETTLLVFHVSLGVARLFRSQRIVMIAGKPQLSGYQSQTSVKKAARIGGSRTVYGTRSARQQAVLGLRELSPHLHLRTGKVVDGSSWLKIEGLGRRQRAFKKGEIDEINR